MPIENVISVEPRDVSDAGLTYSDDEYQGLDLNKSFDQLVEGGIDVTQKLLAGEVPEDVLRQIETVTAEQSLAAGLGTGQAGRHLTARHLGLTSLQLQEKGLESARAYAGLVEAKREYNKEYDLNVARHMETMRQTDLGVAAINEQRREFNATQTFLANELIAKVAMFGAQLQFDYTATKLEGKSNYAAGPLTDLRALIADLQSLIV